MTGGGPAEMGAGGSGSWSSKLQGRCMCSACVVRAEGWGGRTDGGLGGGGGGEIDDGGGEIGGRFGGGWGGGTDDEPGGGDWGAEGCVSGGALWSAVC